MNKSKLKLYIDIIDIYRSCTDKKGLNAALFRNELYQAKCKLPDL